MQSRKKRKGTEEEIGSVCSMDAKRLDTAGSRDAISCLPQEVLGEILSLVPIKLAVSTSVLSNVFASVHNLDFDDSVLLQPEEYKDEWDVIRESFRNFVDRTLALQCTSHIKKFSLKYHIEEGTDMVSVCRWICNAVERCVLEMDLSLTLRFKPLLNRVNGVKKPPVEFEINGMYVGLPCQLFKSKTLVKLTLGTMLGVDKLPPDVSLPALKSLFMDSVVFEFKDLCEVFLPGCPVLEELSVRHEFDWYPTYSLSCRTIKKLTVYYDCKDVFDYLCIMSFDFPSLVSLDYSDYALSEYPLVNLESLVEAKLDLYYSENIERPDISGLIIGISNVETLDLSVDSVDVVSRCVEDGLLLPVFNNLVKLSFGSYNKRGWKLLPYLLKQCPKVDTLIIKGLHGYTSDVIIDLFKVKVLDVRGYKGTAKEMEHLKSLVGGTEWVEKLRVEYGKNVVVDDGNIMQTHKDLDTFLAASKWKTEVAYFN